jgi:hypothetical protein
VKDPPVGFIFVASNDAIAMSRASLVVAAAIVASAALSAAASEGDQHSNRAKVPNLIASQAAGQLFPELCGESGAACGIGYDNRVSCPAEFIVRFPPESLGPDQPKEAWVILDARGEAIYVGSKKKPGCEDRGS